MKILHISDENYFENFNTFPLLSESPGVIVNLIEEKYFDTDLFVINVNYSSENFFRSENCGIRVLKLLRLKNFNQHCIVYSFLTRDYLLQKNPHNLILFSSGVSFVQLPFDFSSLDFQYLSEKQKAPLDLLVYFKAESQLPDNRHFFANWWGVWQLWQVQKAVERIASLEKSAEIEKDFGNAYKEMNSYQGLLARYLNGFHYEDISVSLKKKIYLRNENFEKRKASEILKESEMLKANIDKKEQELKYLFDFINKTKTKKKFQFDSSFKKVLRFIFELFVDTSDESQALIDLVPEIQSFIDKYKTQLIQNEDHLRLLTAIEKEKERIYEQNRKNNRLLMANIEKHNPSISQRSLDDMRLSLSDKKPRILYVDDQAKDGWEFILKRIIYGADAKNITFDVITPNKNQANEDLASEIYNSVVGINADLLILDMRLKGEVGSFMNPEDISGIQVLKQLNSMNLPCPVLVITASNKIRTYKQAMSSGAVAFWTKEGLDERCEVDDTVENYILLVELIYSLCFSKEIEFLYKEFLPYIANLDKYKDDSFWWENYFWGNDSLEYIRKREQVDRETVFNLLQYVFDIYSQNISIKIANNQNLTFDSRLNSLIVWLIFGAIEHIYQFAIVKKSNNEDRDRNLSYQEIINIFHSGNEINVNIRNRASHGNNITFSEMRLFVVSVLEHLFQETYATSSGQLASQPKIDSSQKIEKKNNVEKIIPNEPDETTTYISEVAWIHPNKPDMFFLENPNLVLKDERTQIVLYRNYISNINEVGEVKKGNAIEYNLLIKFGYDGKYNYFAKNARILTKENL